MKNTPIKYTSLCILLMSALAATHVYATPDINVREIIGLFGAVGLAITGLSLFSVKVIVERLTHLRRSRIAPKGFSTQVDALWQNGKFSDLQTLCDNEQHTLARVYNFILRHRLHGREVVSTGAGDTASLELRKHLEKAYPLAVVATIAPLAGLLGTVIGMIESFYVVAATGALGDASILADGIYKALFTTAAGLTVALPVLGFHHYCKSKITYYSLLIEEDINAFIADHFSDNHLLINNYSESKARNEARQ